MIPSTPQLSVLPQAHPYPSEMTTFAAATTTKRMDEPFPLLRTVKSYLDISSLMPPTRLRWSRVLGRPMMETVTVLANHRVGDEIGPVYIDEVLNTDAVISYRYLRANGRRDWHTGVQATDLRGNRTEVWYMRIIDTTLQDVSFEFNWRACYGQPWPKVASGAVHPCLARLYDRYVTFNDEWRAHCHEREDTTYELLQDDSEDTMSDASESGGMSD